MSEPNDKDDPADLTKAQKIAAARNAVSNITSGIANNLTVGRRVISTPTYLSIIPTTKKP